MEAAYAFRGRGGMSGVAPILSKLGAELEPSESQDCWLPWENFLDPSTTRPGAFMGAFRGETFQLTLWIDQYARDLFVCYQEPCPKPSRAHRAHRAHRAPDRAHPPLPEPTG